VAILHQFSPSLLIKREESLSYFLSFFLSRERTSLSFFSSEKELISPLLPFVRQREWGYTPFLRHHLDHLIVTIAANPPPARSDTPKTVVGPSE
jgi:hypothetical protein